jgi:hypothetical protein
MLIRRPRPLLRAATIAGGGAMAYQAGKRAEARQGEQQVAQAQEASAVSGSSGPTQESIPLRDAIRRAAGIPLADSWIHPEDLAAIGASLKHNAPHY